MKELKILESWADSIIAERIEDRPLARSQDIQYQASRMFPDRSPEQALNLFVSNKMADNDKMDFEQNKLINATKRENEKLRRSLGDLANELSNHEQTAADTEREVQRLRDLSAKLKPAGELQQQLVKASQEEITKMVSDIESIRNQQKSDPEAIQRLEKEIQKAQQGQKTQDELKRLTATLAAAKESDGITNDELIARLEKTEKETSEKGEILSQLEKTQQELVAKEKRFQKSLANNAQKIEKWGNKFKELDTQISGLENRAQEVIQRLDGANDDAEDKINRLTQLIYKMNPDVRQQAGTELSDPITQVSNVIDKDEVENNWASSANEPFSLDPEEPTSEPVKKTEPGQEINSISDLLNKPRKIGENVGEDSIEQKVIPSLINIYKHKYPQDLNQWSEEQLLEIIRRTIDGGLLIYVGEINDQRIYAFLERARRWLMKTKPANPELPFDDEMGGKVPLRHSISRQRITGPAISRMRNDKISESLMTHYESMLTKLSGGW